VDYSRMDIRNDIIPYTDTTDSLVKTAKPHKAFKI